MPTAAEREHMRRMEYRDFFITTGVRALDDPGDDYPNYEEAMWEEEEDVWNDDEDIWERGMNDDETYEDAAYGHPHGSGNHHRGYYGYDHHGRDHHGRDHRGRYYQGRDHQGRTHHDRNHHGHFRPAGHHMHLQTEEDVARQARRAQRHRQEERAARHAFEARMAHQAHQAAREAYHERQAREAHGEYLRQTRDRRYERAESPFYSGDANPYATRAQRDRPRFNNPRSPVRGNGRSHDRNFGGNATRFRPAAAREAWNRGAAAAPENGW